MLQLGLGTIGSQFLGDIIPNYKSVWLNIDCPIFLVFKAFCAIECHIKTKINKQKCTIWIYLSKNSLMSNYIERAGCNIHVNAGLGLATDTYNWKENPTFLTKPLTYRIYLCHFIEKVTCITKDYSPKNVQSRDEKSGKIFWGIFSNYETQKLFENNSPPPLFLSNCPLPFLATVFTFNILLQKFYITYIFPYASFDSKIGTTT